MLVIRKDQLRIFDEARLKRFETEMVQHLAAFSPPLFKVLKDGQMREAVRFGIRRAAMHGLSLRGPVRLYLELMLLFGSHFDTDPQYPWATDLLANHLSVSEIQCAEWLYEATLEYQERVSAPDGSNTRKALERLYHTGRNPPPVTTLDFEEALRQEMARIFPQKAEFVGQEGLTALIRAGHDEATRYGLPMPEGGVLVVVLQFAFGHGCADDPLYPWIGRTLRDQKIVDPGSRARRLQRKAMTWLAHVVRGSPDDARG